MKYCILLFFICFIKTSFAQYADKCCLKNDSSIIVFIDTFYYENDYSSHVLKCEEYRYKKKNRVSADMLYVDIGHTGPISIRFAYNTRDNKYPHSIKLTFEEELRVFELVLSDLRKKYHLENLRQIWIDPLPFGNTVINIDKKYKRLSIKKNKFDSDLFFQLYEESTWLKSIRKLLLQYNVDICGFQWGKVLKYTQFYYNGRYAKEQRIYEKGVFPINYPHAILLYVDNTCR